MGKFSRTLNARKKQTNNHPAARGVKIELRQRALAAVGEADAKVFDAFAGDGLMYREVWHRAAEYVGCDLEFYRGGPKAFVADNRRVLRAVDLRPWNIFDLDAYGSPWEQALIVAARRPVQPGETIAMVLTEGSGLKIKMGQLPTALLMLAGMSSKLPGAMRHYDEIIGKAITGIADRMRCDVMQASRARGKTGSQVNYIVLVLRGRNGAPGSG